MEIEPALRELGHLGEAAADGDARDGMAAQIFEQSADEIAHFDERRLGQAVKRAHRRLGGRAGRSRNMGETRRPRHVDAAMDAVDPGGAGEGRDDSRRAENGQAADDPETAVERVFRHLLAAGNRNLDLRVGADAELRRRFRDRVAHHLARDGIDGGFAGRQRQAGPRHRADALARAESNARARRRVTHGRANQRAMSHIRVVARVLHDARAGVSFAA